MNTVWIPSSKLILAEDEQTAQSSHRVLRPFWVASWSSLFWIMHHNEVHVRRSASSLGRVQWFRVWRTVSFSDIRRHTFDKFELFADTVCFCQIMHLLSICRIFLKDQGWRIDLMLSWRKRLWRINFSMFRWFEAFARCLKPSATRSGGEDS